MQQLCEGGAQAKAAPVHVASQDSSSKEATTTALERAPSRVDGHVLGTDCHACCSAFTSSVAAQRALSIC